MAVCAAPHCYNTVRKGFVLVRFPKNDNLRERWESLLGKPDWKSNVHSRLCEEHFELNQWSKYRKILKEDAVPTSFCTCGITGNVPRKSSGSHVEHSYAKTAPELPKKQLGDHNYFGQKSPIPSCDNRASQQTASSRIAKCPAHCPCKTSHLDSCPMSVPVKKTATETSVSVVELSSSSNYEESVSVSKGTVETVPKVTADLPQVPADCVPEVTLLKKVPVDFVPKVTSVKKLFAVRKVPEVTAVKKVPKTLTKSEKQIIRHFMDENEALRAKISELERKNCSTDKEHISNIVQGSEKDIKSKYSLNNDQKAAVEFGTTRGRKWSTDSIRKGLQLKYACNTHGYNEVINKVVPLPSVRTLQRSVEHIKFQPGILTEILDAFSIELEKFSDLDKDCVLLFDEMAIHGRLDVDRSTGMYIGNVTLPGVTGIPSKALVFMFGGIHKNWKLTVCYHFVPKEGHPEVVARTVRELLQRGKDMGLHIKAIVCDMGNRAVLSALGFSTKKEKIVYRIHNPVNPTEYLYCLPDMVHIFKSLKEMLCNNRVITLSDNITKKYGLPSNIVDVKHIEWLDTYQEDMDLKLAPKLNTGSLHPNHFDKMKVGVSRDVINDKTSAGLSLLVKENVAPKEFKTTSFFVDAASNWFKYVTARSHQLSLSLDNKNAYETAIAAIKLMLEICCSMEVSGGWKPCQTHLIMASLAVLGLQEDLLLSGRYRYLSLSRFLQDVVENLFSVIRMQRPNPTPLEFKNRLKQVTLSQFMGHIAKGNYDLDGRKDVVDVLLHKPKKADVQSPVVPEGVLVWSWPETSSDHKTVIMETTLYRMCGYVVTRLINRKSIKCDGCISNLKRGNIPHSRGVFTELTNFTQDAQFAVSDEVFQMCKVLEHNLVKWKPLLQENNVLLNRLTTMYVLPSLTPFTLSTCHDVKEKLVSAFVDMRLKQFSGKKRPRAPKVRGDGTVLSSKSTGPRLLADNFRQNKKKSPSMSVPYRLL